MILLVLVGVAASILGGGSQPLGEPPALGSTRPGPGDVVRTPDGKVLKGPDGKPLRVGKDGRTLVDSTGDAVLGPGGKPLRLGDGGSAPSEVLGLADTGPRKQDGGQRVLGRERDRERRRVTGEPALLGVAWVEAANTTDYDTGAAPNGYAIGEAVKTYVNRTGGVAGRPLEIKYVKVRDDGRSFDAIWTGACEEMAEGERPIAAVKIGLGGSYGRCLEARGIADIGTAPYVAATDEMAEHSNHWFGIGGVSYDRWPRAYILALKKQGFFGRGSRVGFGYVRGSRMFEAGENAMRRALREVGATVVAEFGVEYPDSTADIARAIGDVSEASVRFRALSVNRVVAADAAVGVGLFMGFAEAQGYRPRYGITTASGPTGLVTNAPRRQLENIVGGIGWSPMVDVAQAQDPSDGMGERQECYRILRGAGIPMGARNVLGPIAITLYCDSLLMARAALARSKTFSVAGLRAGIEGISRDSALNLATRIDATRHDGAAGYRWLRYSKSCGCTQYEGPTRPLD